MSSSSTGSCSDNESDDSSAVDALGKKCAKEWDPDGLVKSHRIFALPLAEQLANKTQIQVEENIDKTYESLEHLDCQVVMKDDRDRIVNALKSTYEITRPEKSNVLLVKPGRETIISDLSGSLFSSGTQIGIERLLDEKAYCKDFETIMRDQLAQNIETINVNSFISNCAKFPPEERHCLAKYLLFAMSVCKTKMVVDMIYNSLLDFRDSWTLYLEDFLQVFYNWGIPKELFYPPFIFNMDTCTTNSTPECNFKVADYNLVKVFEYIVETFDGKVSSDLESTMTVLRGLLLMWLDNRFTTSWAGPKFGSVVTRLVDGIDTVSGDPQNVVCRVLDFSSEHMHNQAWIITKLLECKTSSATLVGRQVATQFLLRAFDCEPIAHRGLSLSELHTLLVSESNLLSSRDLYSVNLVLLVVDSYIASCHIAPDDRLVIEALVTWARSMIFCYSDDAQCEILDRQIIVSQMKNIDIKLKCTLEDYFNTEERAVLFGRICSGDVDSDRESDASEDPSAAGRMDVISDPSRL